jgi:IS5 family transposase
VRNWSFEELEREVRANLVYRSFCRIGTEKVPDAKTLGRLARALGSEVIRQLHERLVELARENRVVRGRRLRVDTTVVETNIHYPTDSTLLGDGTRVLTRTMKKIERKAGGLKRRVRNRMRSVNKRVLAIALASRQKGPQGEERRKKHYRELLTLTRRIVNQARRVFAEVKTRRRADLRKLREQLAIMTDRVRQVIRQAKARVFGGDTKMPGKRASRPSSARW